MTFAYRFGDVALRSNTALDGFRLDSFDADCADAISIEVISGAAPGSDATVYRWPDRYKTRLAQLGDEWLVDSALDGVFVVDRAIRTVRAYSAAPPPHPALADVLARRVMPRLVTARGALTIHAAAVAAAGRAVLLFGWSGAGKSTTTAGLAAMGWQLLSDDLSMLWDGTVPVVAPGATGVCVWPASREGLGLDPKLCKPMDGYDGKVRFEPPEEATIQPVPLGACIFLARDADAERATLTPMNRAEALIFAVHQLIPFNPAAPLTEEKAILVARLTRITRDVPMMRLTYPSRFSALPEVAALLAGLVAR